LNPRGEGGGGRSTSSLGGRKTKDGELEEATSSKKETPWGQQRDNILEKSIKHSELL